MRTHRLVVELESPALGLLLLLAPAVAQETTRVSVDSSGTEGDNDSTSPSISADGLIVAFKSRAQNLDASDANGWTDVFVHDRSTGITELVSVDSSGAQGDSYSFEPAISADGRIVAFMSNAKNLVAGDTNRLEDVFVHDRVTGITERVSVDSSGAEGNGSSFEPSISADGQVVAFYSSATNLVAGDTNGRTDVFVHDRVTGITERVSVDSSGTQGNDRSRGPSISADGQVVAFWSRASNLVAGDKNSDLDVFVHDRSTGITERVSVDSSGAEGDSSSSEPSISADGQIVAFYSDATNLVASDANGAFDVFVHDRVTGITERVSLDSSGAEGNDPSYSPSISADGQVVAFYGLATNLVAGDTNASEDAFVHDRVTGITERVSVDSSGVEGNDFSRYPSISADGRVVTFWGLADNLVAGDTNQVLDVFVHERCSIDATWTNYGAGFPGTNGVPSLTSRNDPELGAQVTLDLANSYGDATLGLFFLGFQRAQIHSSWGGDLLLVPALTFWIDLPSDGATITGDIPDDTALCGTTVDLQAIEADPGAAKGVSFTPGLELVLGH